MVHLRPIYINGDGTKGMSATHWPTGSFIFSFIQVSNFFTNIVARRYYIAQYFTIAASLGRRVKLLPSTITVRHITYRWQSRHYNSQMCCIIVDWWGLGSCLDASSGLTVSSPSPRLTHNAILYSVCCHPILCCRCVCVSHWVPTQKTVKANNVPRI